MKQAATLFILFAVLSGRLFAQDVAEAARQAKAAKAAAAHQQAKAAAPQAQQTTQAPEPAPAVQPAANVSTGSTSSRSFIGHRLGETWATFTSTEPDAAQSATSKQGNCVHGYKHFHKTVECKTFILQGWEKRIDIASGFRLDVKYKFCPNVTGTLCAIEVSPNIEMYSRVKLDINQQTEIRTIDLPEPLARIVREFTSKPGYLFATRKGKPLSHRNVRRALKRAAGRTVGFHAFRRFRASVLRKARVPEDLIKLWLGHAGKITDDCATTRGRRVSGFVCDNLINEQGDAA